MGKTALFLGGSGTISTEVVAHALQKGWEVTLVNRGNSPLPEGARRIVCDLGDTERLHDLLAGERFDVVADFHTFTREELAARVAAVRACCGQYIFISSASAYQKPIANLPITESTPLYNPHWQYSRDKIACERYLEHLYQTEGFAYTVVRPSHTYNHLSVPLAIHGDAGYWCTLARMLAGKSVLVHGDGTSLWTLTHARDFARGFVGLMANPHALGEAVHITGDELLCWNDILASVARALGAPFKPLYVSSHSIIAAGRRHGFDFEGPLLGDKAHSVLFDNSKIKRLVPGFVATTRFDEGIVESVEYLLQNPDKQRPDPDFDAFCDALEATVTHLGEA